MAKKFKQMLSAILAGTMVMSSAAGLVSAAESKETVWRGDTIQTVVEPGHDAYTFMGHYGSPAHSYEISHHFVLADGYAKQQTQLFMMLTAEEQAYTWTPNGLYTADGTNNYDLVYCCDVDTGYEHGAYYKRTNLEESTYFAEGNAEHIRAIITNSYPAVSVEQMKKNLAADGFDYASDLTRSDIITAVQAAVWYYANGGEFYYNGTYDVTNTGKWGVPAHDHTNEMEVWWNTKTGKFSSDTAVETRINALIDYLKGLDKMEAASTQVVVSNLRIDRVLSSESGDGSYNANLIVELNNGGSHANDDIAITVTAGENTYTVDVVPDVTSYLFEISAAHNDKITAVVSGTQILPTGAYFYEPEGGRGTSQSMVGVAMGETKIYSKAETTFSPKPIDKYNDGLDKDLYTNVTIKVPGAIDTLGSDIVFIIGNGPANNYTYITDLIKKMLVAPDGSPTKIKIGMVGFADTTEDETVLDLTEMNDVVPGNAVADYRIAGRYNDGKKYTESAEDYKARKAAAFAAWEAENPLLLQDMDYIIAKALERAEDVYSGINLESALITARDMLLADNEVPADRKHMIVVSTGLTYWFDNDEGEPVTIVGTNKFGTIMHGNKYWLKARDNSTNTEAGYYMKGWMVVNGEDGNPDYQASWNRYWGMIENWIDADQDAYVYNPEKTYSEFIYNGNSTEIRPENNSNYRYGYAIQNAEDLAKVTGAVPYFEAGANPATNANADHALNYERAQYEAWVVYNQMQTPIGESFTTVLKDANGEYITVDGLGFNCYAIAIGASSAAGEEDKWLANNQIGYNFMRMLGGDNAVNYYEGDTSFFAPIENQILYYCSVGSYVEDYIGYEEGKGNFEFVTDPSLISVTVGDVKYITTKVEPKDGYDFSLAFTAPNADEPTFWLDYTYGNGKTTEMFTWTFGENISKYNPAALTYQLKLTETPATPYDIIIDTNLSATLYPKNSKQEELPAEEFPVPAVWHRVEVTPYDVDIVIKKVDENGAPLTGAEFELFNAAGESLGNAAVDANGNLTFNDLQVGSYKLVETKTPEGYVGLNEPIFFEVVYANNQFAINMAEEYKLHFPATAYEISNHSYYPAIPQTFVLLNSKNADNWEYTTEYVFGQSDFEVVYCADSTTGTVDTTIYKNYALEDAFSAEVAGNLRAIIANSYPYVSMADMIEAATAARVADAENLTRGDIIAAVQLAIWKYTNDADHTYRGTYSVMDYPRWGKVFHDYTDELPDYLPKNTTKTMQDTAGAARVEALYNYLVSLAPMSVEESPINAVCYIATDGKGVSQTLIGGAAFKGTTITVENRTKYDVDIVIALGAGIAQYDADSTKGTNTYDSIVSLVEPLVNQGINVKLGLVAVEHYDDVAMELTGLTKDNYKEIITEGLNKIQSMPAGPTNLHGNIVAAKKMLDDDTAVPAANKFFYVIATGRTYNFDNADGVPTTIINKVALKGNTYYYWGHYLWQSQRGGHTSLYMIPARYNNDFNAYWADVCKWVEADGDKYAYSFNDAYDVSNPQWFNTFYAANGTDAKALKLASSRFGWILGALTNSGLEAIGSGSNPQNALNYERAQYEAWKAYTAMKDAGYHCYALCSESTSYQNGSPYIQIAKYTGTSTIQLGHSFMNFLAGGNAPLLFVMTDPNTGASEMAKNFFVPVDTTKLDKANNGTENELPMFSKPALEIIRQPENAVAAIGEKVVISVEAEGEGLTYQWFYMNKNGKGFAKSTFKNTTYTVTMAEYCHQRQVYCVITDAYGNTVTTNTVTIERPAKALTILAQPQDVIAAIGEKVTITVEADGDDLTYQWFYKEKNGKEFAQSSYTGKSYVVNMAEYCHQRQVYCVVTDAYGNTVTTDIATMARPAKELVILTQPQDVTAAIGEKVTITVEADGDGLTYQWFYKNKSGKTFAASSIKKKTYSVAMASYCNLREVYCVITDAYGNTVTTDTVTLILD